jgi:two-component system, OmpR family, phosphate regulon sensor histidine kinase PhoR
MTWLLSRLFTACAVAACGFFIGLICGTWISAPWFGAFVGVLVGVGARSLFDSYRGHRLMLWLTSAGDQDAPRDHGLWGELGYRVERALRIQEAAVVQEKQRLAQFLSALEATPNGVLLLGSQDQIVWCNTVSAQHFGLHPQRDILQPVTNLIRAPDFVAYMQAGQFSEPVVVRGVLRNHTTLSVLLRPYGEGLKLLLSSDITEREQAETMRRDFVANVSHEIRTPLTVVSGFIETLVTLSLSQTEQHRVLELMGQQTRRMQTLVSDLLTLAQLEGSPRPAGDHWVDMAKVLAQVHADARALSKGAHHLVVAEVSTAKLAGVESELLSALGNLVSNAVRYTPQGGQITLAWSLDASGQAQAWVQDTGIGIAREHLPRLTERFYRVDSSRSRDTGGTGLGLSIVKHVAQRHGGALHIESESGKGSRLSLVFPASRIHLN